MPDLPPDGPPTRARRRTPPGRGDITALEAEHTPDAVKARLRAGSSPVYLRDFIYGAIDGIVTTFAVVAGAAGAGLETRIALILGVANLLADGFSMSVGNFLGSRAERQRRDLVRAEEVRHIELVPEGEREELRQILAAKGLSGETLESAVEAIAADHELWVEEMLAFEHGMPADDLNPYRAAATTFVAFVLLGFAPLTLFVTDAIGFASVSDPFAWSVLFAAVAFFAVGALKSRFVDQSWWAAGTETLALGGVAAGLAYVVGILLQGV